MPLDELQDDPTILSSYSLWRRIPPWHLVADENRGGVRISSAAFEDDKDGHPMSAVIAEDVHAAGREAVSVLKGLQGFGLAIIGAGLARAQQQRLARSPEDDEPAHMLVIGNKTKKVTKEFYKNARWVIKPPGTSILAVTRLPVAWTVGKTEQTAHELLWPRD